MSLRTKLIAVFLAATLIPLGLTMWFTSRLFETSLRFAATEELETMAGTLETTGREMYRQQQAALRESAARLQPERALTATQFGSQEEEFFRSGEAERFALYENGKQLRLLRRTANGEIAVWTSTIPGPGMETLAEQIRKAQATVQRGKTWDLRRGLLYSLLGLAALLYFAGLTFMVIMAVRMTRPLRRLQSGLIALSHGDLTQRLPQDSSSREATQAIAAFNNTAEQLAKSQQRLVETTRITSWQNLAKKMAHEVKNSLTPIRLTMEEMAARKGNVDQEFLQQASQIVVEEVGTLERRVKAFRDFANEPPSQIGPVNLNQLVEERVGLLRAAHPQTAITAELPTPALTAMADVDLLRGVLTNLIENAAQASGAQGDAQGDSLGQVRIGVRRDGSTAEILVQDSGPGLSALALQTLFEPTISFKKGGMGLGLSIAHRGAVLCGGTLQHMAETELGGAGFLLRFPLASEPDPVQPAAGGTRP